MTQKFHNKKIKKIIRQSKKLMYKKIKNNNCNAILLNLEQNLCWIKKRKICLLIFFMKQKKQIKQIPDRFKNHSFKVKY
jgi:hypothetical protein